MKYVRLNITTEGQTELAFAKNYLANHLISFGVLVNFRSVMTSKNKHRQYRGGLLDYERAGRDIMNWIKEEQKNDNVFFTTMFDLYALPNDFPNFEASKAYTDAYKRVEFLEKSLLDDINTQKFIPYLQLHEFEALVLSKPENLLVEYFERKNEIKALEKVLAEHANNAELINTGRETAPSKRIKALIFDYDKVTIGAEIAGFDGVEALKKRCKHFGQWVEKLEQLNIDKE